MFKNHTYCRACGYAKPGAQGIKSAPTEKMIEVFNLGVQPLANSFCKPEDEQAGYAPLKVLYCPRCSLAQLSTVVDPAILYKNYAYVTSPSDMMKAHFERMINDISEETDGNSVLEIGSNDGRLLGMMQKDGYTVTGVDPAENLAAVAMGNGVNTKVRLFTGELAVSLSQYDIIIARHVFCHVDDWHDFVRGIESVSHFASLVCIEVPYAGNTVKHCEWDTVYHEHLSYLTLKSVNALLKGSRFKIHRIIHYPIHGGAVLLMLRHEDSPVKPVASSFDDNITADDWNAFSIKAHSQIALLKAAVKKLRSEGKTVAGLGASAKSTVWMSACQFGRNDIAFIADNTPGKQWTFSPGTDVPIVDEGAILREMPDYVVVFCWNYLAECLVKNKLYREKGGRFIVPVPEFKIV